MKLNREHIDILDHTEHRAAQNIFCGDSPEMQHLVSCGLMEYVGQKSFVPDKFFRITGKGRKAIKESLI